MSDIKDEPPPERVCVICGKKESEHSIWMGKGDWTHDAIWCDNDD